MEIDDPPLRPVYPVEALVGGFAALTVSGATAAIRAVIGAGRSIYSSRKILRAADAIESYLGGKPKVIVNSAGDLVLMRGDKKVRFDINNPSPHSEPHFHIEMGTPSRNDYDWNPAGPQKLYTFSGG